MTKHIASLLAGASIAAVCATAHAENFDVPGGGLKAALDAYAAQAGIQLIVPADAIRGVQTSGVRGNYSADTALSRILSNTGFSAQRRPSGALVITRDQQSSATIPSFELAQAAPARPAVETVTVTSSKLGGADVQSIPIAITALSQEQLTASQTAGGPDLVKQVPNLTFSKTNFTGYNIQIRGIGTQAISVATDPAVAVAFNDVPFIRNHFFEQEFYDVAQAEVLRGPQGTLYGRNATAGVVNLVSAKPTDQFEAMASADVGNYKNRRLEGMINLPLVDDRLDLRVAGEWTKRDGYTLNEVTNQPIDGRDLWSTRVTLAFKPSENLKAYIVWEHFQEGDDRMRSAKQLCKRAPIPLTIDGVPVPQNGAGGNNANTNLSGYFTQGCLPASLYSPESFEVVNGFGLPYVTAGLYGGFIKSGIDPYASTQQSLNLRAIQTAFDPTYHAKNDVVEFNVDYNVTPKLTFTSQTAFNQDRLDSIEDYNRFNTNPGIFVIDSDSLTKFHTVDANGVFCDPQLGCSDRLVVEDLSNEHAWQLSQEFRLASNFSGPLNFSAGGNYLHYETEENYYVFSNVFTYFMFRTVDLPGLNGMTWIPGVTDGHEAFEGSTTLANGGGGGYQYPNQTINAGQPGDSSGGYIDPNPIGQLDNQGHNYFLSQNPYVLDSYAGFGEAYYQIVPDLKLIGGLRWTNDRKHFVDIPSQLFTNNYGYPVADVVNQQWSKFTGRAAANWTPKLDFTDQTLVYASFAHGYKAGGANPPGAVLLQFEPGDLVRPTHPLTFAPEYINAFELGTKNTLLDGAITFNADVFFYKYKGYQISEIVDRTAINNNFDATIKGAEVEASYEPVPGLKFHFAGGYEHTRLDNGQSAVDLIDRTAGTSGWMVMRPFVGQAANCIMPDYVVAASLVNGILEQGAANAGAVNQLCGAAYNLHLDPVTELPFDTSGPPALRCKQGPSSIAGFDLQANWTCPANQLAPISGYAGFDPLSAPNNGEGFSKNLGGNDLPNAPPFTVSFSAEYSLPVTHDWAATLRGDYYWQDYSWARVFNDNPYDRLRGYTNINAALILTNQNGWQAMAYVKNVFNTTAITGVFLNSDDSGLTTNVFLTDPRLIGVRVTKNW